MNYSKDYVVLWAQPKYREYTCCIRGCSRKVKRVGLGKATKFLCGDCAYDYSERHRAEERSETFDWEYFSARNFLKKIES